MFRKRGKKGISPLIATVLLIAFAVAIATMIMNVGKDFVSTASGNCNDVKLEVQTINGKPLLCYDTLSNKINFMLKNSGKVDITSLRLLVTTASGSDFTHDEKAIDDSAVKSGETIIKNIDYVHSGKFKVEIAPVINAGGKSQTCLQQTVAADDIASCN